MRLALLCLVAVEGCATPPPPPPGPNDALSFEEREELSGIERQLEALGPQPQGTAAGTLLERQGDLLAKAGRAAAASKAYDTAAAAYSQTPEATMMPVIRSQQAREKADALRAKANPPPPTP